MILDSSCIIILIELIVNEFDDTFNIDSFTQPGSGQKLYEEVYLNQDGTQIISDGREIPAVKKIRVCFFLHYYDPNKPLQTEFGTFNLSGILDLPNRLKRLIQYKPMPGCS